MTIPADNSDPRDYILDLSTAPPTPSALPTPTRPTPAAAYLSIHFKCCNVYAPIYKNAGKTAYAGHCPRCQRAAQIAISPTGSTSRVFFAE